MSLSALFLKFAGAGAVGTAGHYLVLVVLVSVFGTDGLLASVAGSILGALINYVLNYYWTFGSDERHRRTFPRFMSVAALGMTINAAAMYLLTKVAAVHYLAAQVCATAMVLVVGFALNAAWTFGRTR